MRFAKSVIYYGACNFFIVLLLYFLVRDWWNGESVKLWTANLLGSLVVIFALIPVAIRPYGVLFHRAFSRNAYLSWVSARNLHGLMFSFSLVAFGLYGQLPAIHEVGQMNVIMRAIFTVGGVVLAFYIMRTVILMRSFVERLSIVNDQLSLKVHGVEY